jgi:hypothetical protein
VTVNLGNHIDAYTPRRRRKKSTRTNIRAKNGFLRVQKDDGTVEWIQGKKPVTVKGKK